MAVEPLIASQAAASLEYISCAIRGFVGTVWGGPANWESRFPMDRSCQPIFSSFVGAAYPVVGSR
jgi:hypothetical protein